MSTETESAFFKFVREHRVAVGIIFWAIIGIWSYYFLRDVIDLVAAGDYFPLLKFTPPVLLIVFVKRRQARLAQERDRDIS